MGSLQAIAQVANNLAQCNTAQLVTTEDGTNVVPVFHFLCCALLEAPWYQEDASFRFTSSDPGVH